jgi:hypothetical protein
MAYSGPYLGEGQPPLDTTLVRPSSYSRHGGEYTGFSLTDWPSDPEKLQKYLDRCPPTLTALKMVVAHIQFMEGVRFPANLIKIDLGSNYIASLKGVQFPPNLTELNLNYNRINSLEGAIFPSTLTTLNLSWNDIQNLDRIQFPPRLTELLLNDNRLIHMSGVQFPPGLTTLDLSNSEERGDERGGYGYNQLKSFNEVKFPPSLTELNLQRNRFETLGKIIEPPPNVLQLIEHQFPKIVEVYRNTLTRQSQQTEQALTRQSQQTEQATLKQISDFNQQSTQNQLRGITSFLREGMEARAQQHSEQLEQEGEERGKLLIYIRLIANRMRYPVPLNATETVQSVLDYINEHYYVSSLVPNCGAIYLYKSSDKKDLLLLTTTRTLADYNVVNGDTLIAECRNIQMNGGGINQTNKKYTIKTRKIKNKNKNKKSKKRWSLKYKKSIDCKRPRGFSQRQYCNYGRKKS